jgi:hypothetical protein
VAARLGRMSRRLAAILAAAAVVLVLAAGAWLLQRDDCRRLSDPVSDECLAIGACCEVSR